MRIMNEDLEKLYFDWLVDLVDGYEYKGLLHYLHSIAFEWVVEYDENRMWDGRMLRDKFMMSDLYNPTELLTFKNDGASVLEVLIAISIRMDFALADIGEQNNSIWFWELIGNLGLDIYKDDVFCRLDSWIDIEETIDIFMSREYDYNGYGGLFPLKNAKEDQRVVELWYQMHNYISEKYDDI